MASGNAIWHLRPRMYIAPGDTIGDFATLGTIVDQSSPPTKTLCLWFDDAADSHADFKLILPPQYSGATGLTVTKYIWASDGTDVDLIEFEFRILDLSEGDDLTGDLGVDTQTAVSLADTPLSTANAHQESGSIAIPKANFSSAAADAEVIVRVQRDVSHAANVDRVGLIGVYVKET